MKILQIGCGNMGFAIASKCLEKLDCDLTIIEKKEISLKARFVFDFQEIKNEKFDIIIIAIKPQDFSNILKDLSCICDEKTTIISIMAAISTVKIGKNLDKFKNIIRIMPNLGLLKNCGVSLFFSNNLNDFSICEKIFGEDGNILIKAKSDERLDEITPFTGSAMAYFLLFAKKLKEYSDENFEINNSENVCINILKSTIDLALNKGIDGGILAISSKGGITKAACDALDGDFHDAVNNAMKAGFERASELSNVK